MHKLIHTAISLSILLLLSACTTGREQLSDRPLYEDPIWRAEAIRAVAQGLREDGEVTYIWHDDVPAEVRKELEGLAHNLVENHIGE